MHAKRASLLAVSGLSVMENDATPDGAPRRMPRVWSRERSPEQPTSCHHSQRCPRGTRLSG